VALNEAPIDAAPSRPAIRDNLSMLWFELGIAGIALVAAALLSVAR
jgi:hypothetical protein